MAAFATYTDLEARLGVTLSADERTRATTLLTQASDLIREVVRLESPVVEDDVLTRPGSYQADIELPGQVVEVTSITEQDIDEDDDPNVVDDDDWYVVGNKIWRDSGWFGPTHQLVITYTHGVATPPATAKSVCVEAVVRVFANPTAADSVSLGSQSTSHGTVGLLLTDAEKSELRKEYGNTRNRTIQLG